MRPPAVSPSPALLPVLLLLLLPTCLLVCVRSVDAAGTVSEVLSGITSSNFTLNHFTSLLSNTSIDIPDVRAALSSPNVTLFAFTDDAYESSIASSVLKSEYFTSLDTLAGVMMYHASTQFLDISGLSALSTVYLTTMLSDSNDLNRLGFGQNQTVKIRKSGSNSYVTTGTLTATILGQYSASNGNIYVVDNVVIPPASLITTYQQSLADSGYSSFMAQAGIASQANDLLSITVLLPSSTGVFEFETQYPNLNITSAVRAALIECHIIPGIYSAADLAGLPKNTVLDTYLSGVTLTLRNGSAISTDSTSTSVITIETPDILIDAGVIHVVSSFALPSIIANGQLPSPLPSLSQIYPDGYTSDGGIAYGSDFPMGAVVGGAVGGVAFIAIVAVFVLVILRRRRIIRRQKQLAEEEAAQEAAEAQNKADGLEEGDGVAHILSPSYSIDLSDTTANASTTPNALSSVIGTPSSVMITKEEEDDDDDDGEEDDEDVQKAMEEARRILEIRRSQWSGADSRRRSSGSVNRESLESSDKRTSISSSSKRLSQLPLPEVTDVREKKRESIRNSWWSATGVGAGVSDPAVLEAQARREEERRSWWSGDGAVTPPSENRRSYLSTSGSDKRRSVVDSEGKRRSTIDPEGRLSVDPDGKKSALDTERRPLGGEGPSESPPMQKSRSRAASRNRKSWWLSTADVVAEENEDENGDPVKIETKTEAPSGGDPPPAADEADKDQAGASGGDASGSK